MGIFEKIAKEVAKDTIERIAQGENNYECTKCRTKKVFFAYDIEIFRTCPYCKTLKKLKRI